MTVSEIITAVDNFAWGPVLIIFSLGCGLLFSIALKFPQIRLFKQMLNCSFKNKKANSGLTPFQALSIAIGGRVGILPEQPVPLCLVDQELYFGCALWLLFVQPLRILSLRWLKYGNEESTESMQAALPFTWIKVLNVNR
mgnify:CR=1 FL=1